MNSFLPEGTEIPSAPSNYTKFKSGDNKIRILDSAIVGYELWVNGKPVRNKTKAEFTSEELATADINSFTGKKKTPQYFWAFPVWNYETEKVEILEVTQTTVMRGIEGCLGDEDYGEDPTNYDLVISRDDDKDPVAYSVRPKPPKAMDEKIRKMYELMTINLEALFEGEDPFSSNAKEEDIDIDDIPDDL